MKLARRLADIVLVLLLTMDFAWTAGHVAFSPTATDLLVRIADRFGLHGTEAVEDFYVTVTLGLPLAVAVAAVTLRRHLSTRSARRRREDGAAVANGRSRPPPEMTEGPGDAAPRRGRARLAAAATLALAVAVLALVFAPEGRLACTTERMDTETSPDGQWSMTLCRRPIWPMTMPGNSGGRGWIVLRDRDGAIRGVSQLDSVQQYGVRVVDTEWTKDRVVKLMAVEFPLVPAPNPFRRWLDDRVWRWRALLGLTPTERMFH